MNHSLFWGTNHRLPVTAEVLADPLPVVLSSEEGCEQPLWWLHHGQMVPAGTKLQREAGPWEGWRSQGRRMERMVTLHTSFSSKICLGHGRCCCCPKKAKEPVGRCHTAKKAIFLRSFNSIFLASSKYKSFLHMKLILLSNWACFIACGWILMNSSTPSLHKQQFLVRRAQLLLSPLILNMCSLEPSKDLGMPRASDA